MSKDDDTVAELTVEAVRDLMRRLEALERKVSDEITIREVVQGETSFIAGLRANGVTRYKRGDLEIELQPADGKDAAAEQLGRAVRGPGYPQRVPAGEPDPPPLDEEAEGTLAEQEDGIAAVSGFEVDKEALREKLEERQRRLRGEP